MGHDKPAPSADLTKGFVREIEGLRAVAIGAVMLHRFWPSSGPLAGYADAIHHGWMGVDLFFVISGFLIAGILFDTKSEPAYFKNFYARRILRIFPLYYVFVAAVLVAFPLAQGGPYFETDFIRSAGSPLYYLLYLGNFPEMIGYQPPTFLSPVWSLAIEEHFYLLFPLLVALLGPRAIVGVLIAAVIGAVLFRLGVWIAWPHEERIQYLATPARFDSIALGALLAAVFRRLPVRLDPVHAHLVLASAAVLFSIALATTALDRTTVFGRIGGYSIVAVTCAALVLWTVVNRERAVTAPLRTAPVMYVGKLCYGLYLLHRPAEVLVDELLARWPVLQVDSVWAIGLKLALALGLATLSWRLIEQPFLRLKDRFTSRSAPLERPTDPGPGSAHQPPLHDATPAA